MKNSILFGILSVLILIFCPSVQLKADSQGSHLIQWKTNYQEALHQSKREGKPVLLFFTGSDWCSYCTKLEKEVLNTAEFFETVKDQYVFVTLDFPKRKSLSSELVVQNEQLANQHGIKSFPTIVLVDTEGNALGSTGYKAGGPHSYAAHLSGIVRPHLSKFSQAATAEGTVSFENQKGSQEKMALEMNPN